MGAGTIVAICSLEEFRTGEGTRIKFEQNNAARAILLHVQHGSHNYLTSSEAIMYMQAGQHMNPLASDLEHVTSSMANTSTGGGIPPCT